VTDRCALRAHDFQQHIYSHSRAVAACIDIPFAGEGPRVDLVENLVRSEDGIDSVRRNTHERATLRSTKKIAGTVFTSIPRSITPDKTQKS
jgi:hypothetical protein